MRLTNPVALWSLILLVVPLLLARRRTPRPRHVVPNLYMWQAPIMNAAARMTLRRLYSHWLVALQVALMATVIVAVAGPVAAVRVTRVAFVFDVSMSMGARDGTTTRLGVARERARGVMERLPPGTVVQTIAASASPLDLGDHATQGDLGRRIDELAPTAGDGDLAAALRLAAARGGVQHTYVFSDRPEGEIAGAAGEVSRAVTWEQVGRPVENLAIDRMAVRRHPTRASEGQLLVQVRNHGVRALDAEVEIAQDGLALGRHLLHLPAEGADTILRDIPRLGSLLSARLLVDDALGLDNRRFAAIPAVDRVHVRLITRGNFFLERVLAANPWITLETVSPESAPGHAGTTPHDPARSGPDVVVCDGCAEPLNRSGGAVGVLIIPPRSSSLAPAALTVARPEHRVAASLELRQMFVTLLPSVGIGADGDVLLRAGGLPAAIAFERGDQRILELRVDVAAPDLALSTGFPILVANAIDWLASRGENRLDVAAGEPVRWLLPGRFGSELVSTTGPDGRPTPRQLDGRYLTIVETDAPGSYHVRTPVADQIFVVNPAVHSESNLTRAGEETHSVRSLGMPQSTADERNVAPWLLLLAFGFLAAEWQCRWRWSGRPS